MDAVCNASVRPVSVYPLVEEMQSIGVVAMRLSVIAIWLSWVRSISTGGVRLPSRYLHFWVTLPWLARWSLLYEINFFIALTACRWQVVTFALDTFALYNVFIWCRWCKFLGDSQGQPLRYGKIEARGSVWNGRIRVQSKNVCSLCTKTLASAPHYFRKNTPGYEHKRNGEGLGA